MPLAQPKRYNPLMANYFRVINMPGARLAKRCGVSHSQVYMARTRNVGADNAEKIVRGMTMILGLSEAERLELKAEIMGHPGEIVRAYLGDSKKAARLLNIPEPTAREILDPGKSITHKSGTWALDKLREMGAPAFVIESVDRRLMPPPEPRRGRIAHDLHGPELGRRYVRTKASLATGKPTTHQAIQRSGLLLKEIRARAGVGKETMRRALYRERLSARSARAIAGVLGEAAALSEDDIAAVEKELREPPRKNF
jgi:hypothetical protein